MIGSLPRPARSALSVCLPVLLTAAIVTAYALAATRLGTGPPSRALFRWDGFWYGEVAQHGYRQLGADGYKSAAFFPLLPAVTHLLTAILPGLTFAQVALVVVVTSTVLAMVLVDRLVSDWPWWQRAAAVALLMTLPSAFFYAVFYAESPFLLAEVFTLWCLGRRERQWLAPLGAVLATLARPLGIVLVVPVAIVLVSRSDWSPAKRALLASASGMGALILLLTYAATTGNALAFLAARSHWSYLRAQGYVSALGRSAPRTLDLVATNAALAPGFEPALAAAVWGLVIAVPLSVLALRWRRPYGWYAALMVLLIAAVGSIESQSRMLLVVLPLWLAPLALYRERRRTWAAVAVLVAAGFAFNVYMAARFASGGWAG